MSTSRVTVAQEALTEANRRREVARAAVAEFALRAVVEGQAVESVMDACGFREEEDQPVPEPGGIWSLSSMGFAVGHEPYRSSPRERFAAWLAEELRRLICESEGKACIS